MAKRKIGPIRRLFRGIYRFFDKIIITPISNIFVLVPAIPARANPKIIKTAPPAINTRFENLGYKLYCSK